MTESILNGDRKRQQQAGDSSGRDRIAGNVLSSWGGHLVFVVAGFILPRAIDHHVGQASLGVWDFSWSLVNYFGMAQIGVGSSVNRYVAMHRSANDIEGLRRSVSSVMCIQIAASVLVAILTLAAGWAVPVLFASRLGSDAEIAASVVALLGGSLVIQMAFDAFRGVITGCHRWGLYNGLNAISHGVAVAGMLMSLSLGGGLVSLGWVNLIVTAITEAVRAAIAMRVCPELRIRFSHATLAQSRDMLKFGGKTIVEGLSHLLLSQGTSIIVASYLGPAALAVYSRPVALVRHTKIFINKFAFVLTPTAGALHGSGRKSDLRKLLIDTSIYGVSFTLPVVLVLAILGDPILLLWMGPRYAQGALLAILATGYFLPLTQRSVVTIMTGMNLHGRVGFVNLGLAIVGIALGVAAVGYLGWGLVGAALAVVVPYTIGNGVLIPMYACRRLDIPIGEYARRSFIVPAACCIPFAVCLVVIRIFLGDMPLVAIVSAGAAGMIVLGPLFWRFMLSEGARKKCLELVPVTLRSRLVHESRGGN